MSKRGEHPRLKGPDEKRVLTAFGRRIRYMTANEYSGSSRLRRTTKARLDSSPYP